MPAFCFDSRRPVAHSSESAGSCGSVRVTALFACALRRWDRRDGRDSGRFHAPRTCVLSRSCDCVRDDRAIERRVEFLCCINPAPRVIKGLRGRDPRDSAQWRYFPQSDWGKDFKEWSVMAVTGTTSVFRVDGDDHGRRSRRCNPRASKMRIGGRRASNGSSGVKCGSVAAKRSGSGKFLLVGAVLAIQFVGAAAMSSKGECFFFRVSVLVDVVGG